MKLSEKVAYVCNSLKENGIDFEIVTHSPAFTLEECQKINSLIGGRICKNLLLKTDSGKTTYLLLIRDDKRFVTKEISKKLGCSRLSFASAEYMKNLLNTEPGSLSITSLFFDKEDRVLLAIDSDVIKEDFVCCHPSDNTATLKIRTEDILEKLIPLLNKEPKIIEID